MSFLIFYFSYLFSVLFLTFMIFFIMLVCFSNSMFIKFLVILVYVSGVVVFILYISCMCWNMNSNFSKLFLFPGLFIFYLMDFGTMIKFTELGEFFWMFLFFSFLFNSLVMSYSLNLFKVSGSLRF